MGIAVKRFTRLITHLGIGGLLLICGALPAMAGGFTQSRGFTFTDLGFNTFDTNSYHKREIQLYLEYGLQENVTLIFESAYDWLQSNGNKNQGFTDQEVGWRWRFNRDPNLATAIQGLLIVPPGYSANQNPALGYQVVGVELSLPVSRSFQLGKRNGYGTLEVGYRDYLGPPSNELRLSGEVSLDVAKRLAIATQFFSIYRLRSGDINYTQLGVQLRWRLTDPITLVLGAYKNVSGEGGGFQAQLWYNFGRRRPGPITPIQPGIPSGPPAE